MATPRYDLDYEEEDAERAASTRRDTRPSNPDRLVALRKCPRCGHYYAEMFFKYPQNGSICRLCEHEAQHPLIPTRIAKGA